MNLTNSILLSIFSLLYLGGGYSIQAQTPSGMVLVEGGTFLMGSENGYGNERPIHSVSISSFYIDTYEVSNDAYCLFLNAQENHEEGGGQWLDIEDKDCLIIKRFGKYKPRKGYERNPVVEVTWYGAYAYAQWIGKRLPTEAEWEYAARGGLLTKSYEYAGGNQVEDVAWFRDNTQVQESQPVGLKKKNELGLYDMSGNVWEWCNDWYRYYDNQDQQDPTGPDKGTNKVLRGGSWDFPSNIMRLSSRHDYPPASSYGDLGFRCVKNVVD